MGQSGVSFKYDMLFLLLSTLSPAHPRFLIILMRQPFSMQRHI